MHVSLIVPAPFDLVSGGYGYDRRIVSEMRAAGHQVDVLELTGQFPLPDEKARESAHAIWAGLATDTTPVIDGLALPAFRGFDDMLTARGAVGLIHHPVSMETGIPAAEQTMLDAAERHLFRCMRRLIVTSGTTAETLTSHFQCPADTVRRVVPGTDDAPRCAGSAGTVCEILSIGTLIPRKGHDLLLHALARLFDLNWHLTIVGSPDRDPTYARTLLALTAELNIQERVRFAGELVDAPLDALWRGADIFALATRYEGYGMVIAEALKHGLPVVVTNGGAAGQLLTPDSGCLCPVDDRDQVSKSLRRLIFDKYLRLAMAEAAWQVGQQLPSWHTQAALFADALI